MRGDTIRFNGQALKEGLLRRAERAATEGAYAAHRRIVRHAPVRKIFKGTTYRDNPEFSGYASPAGRARSPVQRRAFRGSGADGTVVTGHANAFQDIVFKSPGNRRTTGDYRRVKDGRLEQVQQHQSTLKGGSFKDLRVGVGSARSRLTGRGRYEVASGRANFTSGGVTRVGGRLRSEIYVVEAERHGMEVWAYVVSPTPYAPFMEFGTGHNRPYPYMRPGLAESRIALKRAARRHLPPSGGG